MKNKICQAKKPVRLFIDYAQRNRKQTEKGEKLAEDRRKKRSSGAKKSLNCSTCTHSMLKSESEQCSICTGPLHKQCTVVMNNGSICCKECMKNCPWDEIEDIDENIHIPKDAALWRDKDQIEQYRITALARLTKKTQQQQSEQKRKNGINKKGMHRIISSILIMNNNY